MGFEKRCGKIGHNALTVTNFTQLLRAQIGPKLKFLFVHQIAIVQPIVLSPEIACAEDTPRQGDEDYDGGEYSREPWNNTWHDDKW